MRSVVAVLGLGSLIIGVALVVERLGPEFRATDLVVRYWPVVLIAVGVAGLTRLISRPTVLIGPLVVTALGTALLFLTIPPLRDAIAPWTVPAVLVVVGAGTLVRLAMAPAGRADEALPRRVLVADSGVLAWPVGTFSLGHVVAVASGRCIDLHRALPMDGEARLDLTAVGSGLVVRIPAGWKLDLVPPHTVLGRVRTIDQPQQAGARSRIEVHALLVMATLDIEFMS